MGLHLIVCRSVILYMSLLSPALAPLVRAQSSSEIHDKRPDEERVVSAKTYRCSWVAQSGMDRSVAGSALVSRLLSRGSFPRASSKLRQNPGSWR
jgi:hypothetical protein